jgi:hypothetical protein
MSDMGIIAVILTGFALAEGLFFIYVIRIMNSSKRSREEEFAIIDRERQALLELQKTLMTEAQAAKTAAKDGVSRLQQIGLQTHAEWTDMTSRFDEVVSEIEVRSQALVDDVFQALNRKSLECRKIIDQADASQAQLADAIGAASKVSRFFDSQVKIEDLMRELQQDKYQEARRLLALGSDAQFIAKKLGISVSEVSLVSHTMTA